jgi:hypothetical protein
MAEEIFFVAKTMVSTSDKIVCVANDMVFGVKKICYAIFPVVGTSVSATEKRSTDTRKILAASDNIFFATDTIFAIFEKIIGEALLPVLVATMNELLEIVIREISNHY